MNEARGAVATGALLLLLLAAGGAIYMLARGPAGPAAGPAARPLLPEEPAGRALAPTDMAVFGAEVVATEGVTASGGPPIASGCLLRVQLIEGPGVGHLTVKCGDLAIYRSVDPAGADRAAPEREIAELPGPGPASHRYALRYLDVGRRSGPRPQIDVDTRAWRARIFSEGDTPWSISLHVADLSFPRWGGALGRPAETAVAIATLRLRATSKIRRGDPPFAQRDAACELYIRSDPPHQEGCRVLFRCGDELLYGAAREGRAHCVFEEGLAVTAVDAKPSSEDGDPMLRFDRRARTLYLEDDAWTTQWTLDEPPRCGMTGPWHGFGVDSKATPWELSLDATGQQLVFGWKMGSRHESQRVDAPARCAGLIELHTGDDGGPGKRYQLELGPGWRSFGGRWEGDQAGLLAASSGR